MFVWWMLTTLTACSPIHNRRPSSHLWFPWQLIAADGKLRFMTGDIYTCHFLRMRHVEVLYSEGPPQVLKLQQRSGAVPGPCTGIPRKGSWNHTTGIQTPHAIKEAKCRGVFIVIAFYSLIILMSGHQSTAQERKRNIFRGSLVVGARWTAGGWVKNKEFSWTIHFPSRLWEGDASHSSHAAIFSLHTTLRFKFKAKGVGLPRRFWK